MTLARLPRGRVLAMALVVLALLLGVPLTAPAAAAGLGPGSLTLSVLDVSPSSPTPSQTPQTVKITFRARNNTSQPLTGVVVSGVRASPIDDQKALDAAMSHPAVPDRPISIDTGALTFDVPAGGTTDAVFTTITEIPENAGICQCANAIYPLFFTASIEVDGKPITLATTQTYIPDFMITEPAKVQVGWVWPLLDVPHRLTSSTVFRNDDLATEIAPGGRLDRALTVLETVSPTVPMTVVTDPDLLDELEVMAEGNYQVQQPGKPPTLGVGSGAAAAWLSRLRGVFTSSPDTELDLTPYGDPDVEGLQQNGLAWSASLPTDVAARVTSALGGLTPPSDIAWPLGETLSKNTLDTLVQQGTQTVILNSQTLPTVLGSGTSQNALASLTTKYGSATAGIVNPSIQTWAAKVMTPNGAGAGYLPQLVAQVALNAVTSVDQSHFVLITPPRLLDVDPTVAERAIRDTSTGVWATPMPLRKATHSLDAKATSTVKTQRSLALSDGTVDALRYLTSSLPGLSSMFLDADRQTVIGTLPTAGQLAASSSFVLDPTHASSYSGQLQSVVLNLRNGVHLVTPNPGSYTLTSTNASLPITIANSLSYRVQIDVMASAVGGVPGFAATPIESKVINPRSTVQVRLPTHFDRPGRIEIEVTLSTPTDLSLGQPIRLRVRSTALGTIGVVITAVAAVVLVGALIVRATTRMRRRNQKQAGVKA